MSSSTAQHQDIDSKNLQQARHGMTPKGQTASHETLISV